MRLWQSLLLLLGAGAGYVRHGHGARELGLVWRQTDFVCLASRGVEESDLSSTWKERERSFIVSLALASGSCALLRP